MCKIKPKTLLFFILYIVLFEGRLSMSKVSVTLRPLSAISMFMSIWPRTAAVSAVSKAAILSSPSMRALVFFVKHFSLKKASEFPVFSEGFSLL